MRQNETGPLRLVVIICPKAKAHKTARFLNEGGFGLHYVFLGKGTAPSEITAYLGLSEPEKVVFLLTAGEERARELLRLIEESDLDFISGQGIAFIVPFNSVCNRDTLNLILEASSGGPEKTEL